MCYCFQLPGLCSHLVQLSGASKSTVGRGLTFRKKDEKSKSHSSICFVCSCLQRRPLSSAQTSLWWRYIYILDYFVSNVHNVFAVDVHECISSSFSVSCSPALFSITYPLYTLIYSTVGVTPCSLALGLLLLITSFNHLYFLVYVIKLLFMLQLLLHMLCLVRLININKSV